jgi:hypothetical protein
MEVGGTVQVKFPAQKTLTHFGLSAERHPVVNKELASLSDYLYRRHVEGRLDGFCTYLYGVIHGHLAEQPVSLTAEELSQDLSFSRKPQVFNICYYR